MSNEALILDALRTPIGRKDGALAHWRPDDLAGEAMGALVKRNGIDPAAIDDIVLGCVTQVQEQGFNIARNAALAGGFPVTVPAAAVNRLCASSLQACAFAAAEVLSGQADLVIGAGTESMSRVPMGSDGGPFSPRILDRFDLVSQGISAEFIAEKWQLSRKQLDEFSFASHQKALKADFKPEILPLDEGQEGELFVGEEKEFQARPCGVSGRHAFRLRRAPCLRPLHRVEELPVIRAH